MRFTPGVSQGAPVAQATSSTAKDPEIRATETNFQEWSISSDSYIKDHSADDEIVVQCTTSNVVLNKSVAWSDSEECNSYAASYYHSIFNFGGFCKLISGVICNQSRSGKWECLCQLQIMQFRGRTRNVDGLDQARVNLQCRWIDCPRLTRSSRG